MHTNYKTLDATRKHFLYDIMCPSTAVTAQTKNAVLT